MNILKRWRGNTENSSSEERPLTKHGREDGPLGRLRGEMDRIFDRMWREFDSDPFSAMTRWPEPISRMTNWPAMDMAEDGKTVTIRLDVPGLDAKDVDVEVSGNQLSIRGQRQDELKQEDKGVCRRERYSGSFARTITLPSYVDPGKVDAKYDKGTLTITVPKIPGQGPKRVQVKSQ